MSVPGHDPFEERLAAILATFTDRQRENYQNQIGRLEERGVEATAALCVDYAQTIAKGMPDRDTQLELAEIGRREERRQEEQRQREEATKKREAEQKLQGQQQQDRDRANAPAPESPARNASIPPAPSRPGQAPDHDPAQAWAEKRRREALEKRNSSPEPAASKSREEEKPRSQTSAERDAKDREHKLAGKEMTEAQRARYDRLMSGINREYREVSREVTRDNDRTNGPGGRSR